MSPIDYYKINQALAWAASLQMKAPLSSHHERAIGELWPILEPLGIRTALEVGAGEAPSHVYTMLKNHNIDVTASDTLSCNPPHVYADMHDLPFHDESFDIVISRHSLEHALIPYLALVEMSRVSRRWLLVVVPWDSDKAYNWPDHLYVTGRKGWEAMFRHLNLSVTDFEEGDHTEKGAPWKDLEWRYLLQKP